MSELLSYINLEEYVICNKAIYECFRYLDTKLAEKNNNFVVQAIAAVSDKKQIEKIKPKNNKKKIIFFMITSIHFYQI